MRINNHHCLGVYHYEPINSWMFVFKLPDEEGLITTLIKDISGSYEAKYSYVETLRDITATRKSYIQVPEVVRDAIHQESAYSLARASSLIACERTAYEERCHDYS